MDAKKILLFVVLNLLIVGLSAQNVLLVKKSRGKSRYIYKAGQYISLRTTEGEKIYGPINAIRADYLIIDYIHEVSLSSVEVVYAQRRLLDILGTYVTAVSTLYMGLDLLNNRFDTQHNGWKTAGITAGTGLAAMLLSTKRMSNKKGKWRFEILSI